MQANEVAFLAVQSSDHKFLARALILEYLHWIASVARDNYGIEFDVESMVASDIEDTAKFYPPNGRFYLVMHQGQAVGVGCLKTITPTVGEVQRIYVQPHIRGLGAGRKLIERLIADAQGLGFHSVRLENLKALEVANALYRSVGFVEIEPYSGYSMKSYQPPESLVRYQGNTVFMELALVQLQGNSSSKPALAKDENILNPWLTIPLEDYEGHMSAAEVDQLTALAELFGRALDRCSPSSVAVLGVAGGNGLDQIDTAVITRVVGVDINQQYLDEVHQRFRRLPGLELHCRDLTKPEFNIAPVALVHAALIFEHVGLGLALINALTLVAPGGAFSVVLQLPSAEQQGVASTTFASMQSLKHDFALIDVDEFHSLVRQKGFRLTDQETRSVHGGKALWLGIFTRLG